MTKKLHATIQDAYVTAYRLHAMYDERFNATHEDRDFRQMQRQNHTIDALLPILDALPINVRQPIYAAARDAAQATRQTTRDEMRRTRAA